MKETFSKRHKIKESPYIRLNPDSYVGTSSINIDQTLS